MGILIPAALALLALAIPIIIFYMLRLRREELDVSSSLLWRRALQDRTANAPWQRLRRNLLLLLQLLLLLLLVLGLARPFLYRETVASGNLVVVLDASVSMQATDEAGGESRFARARREADALVDGLQGVLTQRCESLPEADGDRRDLGPGLADGSGLDDLGAKPVHLNLGHAPHAVANCPQRALDGRVVEAALHLAPKPQASLPPPRGCQRHLCACAAVRLCGCAAVQHKPP